LVGGCEGPLPLLEQLATFPSPLHAHHPLLRACSALPREHEQPGTWHRDELVGPQRWLVVPWGWCHAADEEIVCEKSLEGDAGPRLPCGAAEVEQRGTRRYRASFPLPFPSYLLLIELITWLRFCSAPRTRDAGFLGSTKVD